MSTHHCDVGAFVWGAPTASRALVRHAKLLAAYADGEMLDRGDAGEAYLSHFAFGPEMQEHYRANRQSVAGFTGACRCPRLTLDVDREALAEALADARRLVTYARHRYGSEDVPVYFSGGKGFHVDIDLVNEPPPAVGFQHVARAFAEATAARAGVRLDTSIYDVAHLIKLPNTRHPRTGLYKRRIDADALFALDVAGIVEHAKQPAGDGLPPAPPCHANLAADWREAELAAGRAAEARDARRGADGGAADQRAPRYFVDFLRFETEAGERHKTLFRCAAWLAEQGAPEQLCFALLREPGCDNGLSPRDVDRQIACGIGHARRQQRGADGPPTDPDAFERWAIEHEGDPTPPRAAEFEVGELEPLEGGRA